MFGKKPSVLASFLISAFALAGCALESNDSGGDPNRVVTAQVQREFDFVKKVILGSEFSSDGLVARYSRPARVSIMSGARTIDRDALTRAIANINSALAKTQMRVYAASDNDASAEIYVYFAPSGELPRIARNNGFEFVPGNSGLFWNFWNDQHEIQHSVVLIATDQLSGSLLQSVVLEEVTQSLGPATDQDFIPGSIFYETDRDSGNATQLSALDKKLLEFLYRDVSPGANQLRVESALMRNW